MNFTEQTMSNIIGNNVQKYLDIIRNEFRVALVLNEFDNGYMELNKIIRNLDKKKYDENRLITKDKNICSLSIGSRYFIKAGTHDFIHIDVHALSETTPWIQEMTIEFYGKNKKLLKKKLLRKLYEKLGNDKITIHQIGSSYTEYKVKPHTFDSIILYPEVKKNIISGLTNWKLSKDWYKNHQMVHKIGVLLYGQPGCGKSSVIRAISTLFHNAPIIMLDTMNVESSIRDLVSKRHLIDGPMIVVFEDFDMMFFNREEQQSTKCEDGTVVTTTELKPAESTGGKSSMENNKNQNLMFQILDGMYSTEETIYIATTNHIERIDPAMIRHGRFDIQEELKPFDKTRAIQFLKLFDLDEDFFNLNIEGKYELPIQPAKLQAAIMEYRAEILVNSYMKNECK